MAPPEDSAPFARIASYYDALVDEHGDSAHACDYGDPRSQTKRFEVLTSGLPLDGAQLLDVGCGLGHLADYLEQRGFDVSYTGVDLSPRMIELAQERRADLDVRVADILTDDIGRFDVVIANGIFYLLGEHAEEMMRTLVTRMFELARAAIAFNSLSTWASDQEEGEFY
ncbi:MAG: hypothetical protein QOJ29_2891, partial [Thermoleophilaceae bacterium]|nr:hypothetical protein [Thermoleophilaceae bacterium]